MQKRHLDGLFYFKELANTSKKYYIDYLSNFIRIETGCKVLEIGCGEGGNILPLAEIGCDVTGVDRSEKRIEQAKAFFQSLDIKANFIACDFFDLSSKGDKDKYDIILIHDVIEHIYRKDRFFEHVKQFVAKDGIVFWRFPAWQMPFGGHQQIGHSRISSKLPFIHLLPTPIYRFILLLFGETKGCVEELIDVKKCRVSIEKFERLMNTNKYELIDKRFWFINPHYEQKFKLKPRKLNPFIGRIRYLRNFFTTSCFYITKCT